MLRGKQTESEVIEVMGYICQQKYFDHKYSYPTWELTDACTKFRADHEEKLEQYFVHREAGMASSDFVEDVCGLSKTKACKDVDRGSLKDLKPDYKTSIDFGMPSDNGEDTIQWTLSSDENAVDEL